MHGYPRALECCTLGLNGFSAVAFAADLTTVAVLAALRLGGLAGAFALGAFASSLAGIAIAVVIRVVGFLNQFCDFGFSLSKRGFHGDALQNSRQYHFDH